MTYTFIWPACSFQAPPGPAVPQVSVVIARGKHLFPFRTEQLSPSAPMVLGVHTPGRVGRRRSFLQESRPRAALFRFARRRSGEAPRGGPRAWRSGGRSSRGDPGLPGAPPRPTSVSTVASGTGPPRVAARGHTRRASPGRSQDRTRSAAARGAGCGGVEDGGFRPWLRSRERG